MSKDPIYEREERKDDPGEPLGQILGLCKLGIAGTDTCMNVDLDLSGHKEQYEMIFRLAFEALVMFEEAEADARVAARVVETAA